MCKSGEITIYKILQVVVLFILKIELTHAPPHTLQQCYLFSLWDGKSPKRQTLKHLSN